MRRGPSPRFSPPSPRHHVERSYRSLDPGATTELRGGDPLHGSERQYRAPSWTGLGESHSSQQLRSERHVQRVSDALQPTLVNDVKLQRMLKRMGNKNRRVDLHGMESHGPKGEEAEYHHYQPKQQYDRHHYSVHDGAHSTQRVNSPPTMEKIPFPRPIVDVVGAFNRTDVNDVDDSFMSNRVAGVPAATLSQDPGAALRSEHRKGASEQRALQTTPPRVHIEEATAEPNTESRYHRWRPSPIHTERGVAATRWSPVHGTRGFSSIQVPDSRCDSKNSGGTGQYTNPVAAAERILYALLRQNEKQGTVTSSPGRLPSRTSEGEQGGSDHLRDVFSTEDVSAFRVTPQEGRMVLDIVRAKDREILQLRSSLLLSYRYAACVIHRHQHQLHSSNAMGSSLSLMESRFLSAVANAVNDTAKDAVLLVNQVPPHVHGLPNVPLPLCLPCSVGKVSGVLSMLNVEDMLHKKKATRIFLRSWCTFFVVADDRCLSIYRSEEDYIEHAFQRAIVVVPFKDMEYFVPSFRNLPMSDEELLNISGRSTSRQRGWATTFFSSFVGLGVDGGNSSGRRSKKKKTTGIGGGGNGDADERSNRRRGGSQDGNVLNDGDTHRDEAEERQPVTSRRTRSDLYDALMARIALEHATDASYAYFGFIAKQPNTHMRSEKVVNPPILFRSQSVQEHAEWVHYLSQCFNRKLYRQMFPSALAASYAGTDAKETQTSFVEILDTPLVASAPQEETPKEMVTLMKNSKVTYPALDRASQTESRVMRDAVTNTDKQDDGHEVVLLASTQPPPPPSTSPPKKGRIEHGCVYTSSGATSERPHLDGQVPRRGEGSVAASASPETISVMEVPWKELATELRELLAVKNREHEKMQLENEELRYRVQQMMQEVQQLTHDREGLIQQVKEGGVRLSEETRQLEEARQNLLKAHDALHGAEEARRTVADREKEHEKRIQMLQDKLDLIQPERDLLAAELLAVKDGYNEGLRSLARKALGDIDCLHDVYSAGEYMRAMRDNRVRVEGDIASPNSSMSKENENNNSNDSTLSLPKRQEHVPNEPPPATSLCHQGTPPQFQRRPLNPSRMKRSTSPRNATRKNPAKGIIKNRREDVEVLVQGGDDAIGVAMLLISFVPQHLAIDGCFTVDEGQARLLQSGPSATQRGRQWVMLHHDTGAVFSVTAELQTDLDAASPAGVKRGKHTMSHRTAPKATTVMTTTPRKALLRHGSTVREVPGKQSRSSRQLREGL